MSISSSNEASAPVRRWLTIAAFALLGTMLTEGRGAAQPRPEVESETPAQPAPPPAADASIIYEAPDDMVSKLEFDSSKLESAKLDVLFNRNWFLASAGAQALGWILLGASVSQCQWINDVEQCPRAADTVGVAGAAIVILSAVPLLTFAIMYGLRAGQKKKLELKTLQQLTESGRYPPPASFDEYRLTDAQDRIRAARNGLIASAAMFSVGWIFLGFAIPRCQTGMNDDLLTCSGPGYAHLVIGLTIGGSGAIGLIVSGILLGVRKANKKALERSIQRRDKARFRWDPKSASFVF